MRWSSPRGWASNDSEVVDDDSATDFDYFGGHFFGNFRDNASVIIQDMQAFVVFSVIPKCITLTDPE